MLVTVLAASAIQRSTELSRRTNNINGGEMNSEKVSIHLFDITGCGYFKRGEAEPEFGSVTDMLDDLKAWITGKALVDTSTAPPNVEHGDFPIYLSSLARGAHDDWLLVTWNETPSSEGKVASIPANAVVGSAQVVMNDIEANTIPGFATYFWFMPEHGLLATVRFSGRVNGLKGMNNYVDRFMANFSRHVTYSQQTTDAGEQISIKGYVANAGDEALATLSPRLRIQLKRLPTELERLRTGREQIRKMIRKTTLERTQQEDRALWQKALHSLGLSGDPVIHRLTTKIKLEIEGTPTEGELEEIFSSWENAGHDDAYDDVGFVMQGYASEPVWLDSTIAKGVFEIDIERSELIDAAAFLQKLVQKRADVLSII